MKKFAKLLAMVLAVSMVLTMFVGAVDYKDAAKITEGKEAAVEAVYEAGIMMGNDKGEFNPLATLTRDEMAKILFALSESVQKADDYSKLVAQLSFTDYDKIPNWSKGFVGYAAEAAYIVGNDKGEANALGTLSYVEAAIMLMRTLDITGQDYTVGEDTYAAFEGPKWYQNAVIAAYGAGKNLDLDLNAGLFTGLDVTDFKAVISREDVAVMIANAMAINAADDSIEAYALATPAVGTVTGTTEIPAEEEDEDPIPAIVLDDETAYPSAGFDVDAIMGHEINFIVEGDEILDIKVADPMFEGTFVGTDLAVVPNEDETDAALTIKGETVIESVVDFGEAYAEAPVYVALNATEYAADVEPAGAIYDEYYLIINENSICVKVAPVQFKNFAEGEWAPEEGYDAEEGAWTGEFTVEFGDAAYDISTAYAELEEVEGWYSYQVIDGELVNLKALDVVEYAELEADFDAKAGKYSVTYNDTELFFDADEEENNAAKGNVWTELLKPTEDVVKSVVLYNGFYVVETLTEEIEEEPAPENDVFYGFIEDYEVKLEIVEDDEETEEDESGFQWIITVKASFKGETKDYVYVGETQADPTFVAPEYVTYGFAKFEVDTEGKTVGTPVEVAITTVDITSIKDEKVNDVDFEDVEFYDLTNAGLTLADLSYEANEAGQITFKVAGKRVSATFIAGYEYDGQLVVVFDPAKDFGDFGANVAE